MQEILINSGTLNGKQQSMTFYLIVMYGFSLDNDFHFFASQKESQYYVHPIIVNNSWKQSKSNYYFSRNHFVVAATVILTEPFYVCFIHDRKPMRSYWYVVEQNTIESIQETVFGGTSYWFPFTLNNCFCDLEWS